MSATSLNSENTVPKRKRGAPKGFMPPSAWKPGQSGNPGGRPKGIGEVMELARKQTPEAIERLVFWMRSEFPAASIAAVQTLLDRAWGKPMQAVEATGRNGGPIQIEDVTDVRKTIDGFLIEFTTKHIADETGKE